MTSDQFDLSLAAWALLAVSAVIVGVSKTAIPGMNTLSIAVFAAVLPARASTGALLLLLIVGDAFALIIYRRHANWPALIKLIPAVIMGIALGTLFLAFAPDDWVRRVIGIILLLVVAITLWRRARPASEGVGAARLARIGYGSLGGFSTMVANAGGPVMSMYFLAARFPVKTFLGTVAWFFAVINLAKVPISISLGLITADTATLSLVLVPGVVLGALVGRWIAARINQRAFDRAVIVCTLLGAGYLVLG